jgi:hypothetical protein
MKQLLILMILSSPAYAGDDYDREYNYRQRYQLNSWSAFDNQRQATVNIKPQLDTDGDCRKYKQYSSGGNSVNCDFDGNIQQYKEYSTHKR